VDGYYDEHCYFNNPPDYMANLSDSRYLDTIRAMRIVLATGEFDICRADAHVCRASIAWNSTLAGHLGRWNRSRLDLVAGDGPEILIT
jgi:esterase/lipase superfamily enzyme